MYQFGFKMETNQNGHLASREVRKQNPTQQTPHSKQIYFWVKCVACKRYFIFDFKAALSTNLRKDNGKIQNITNLMKPLPPDELRNGDILSPATLFCICFKPTHSRRPKLLRILLFNINHLIQSENICYWLQVPHE